MFAVTDKSPAAHILLAKLVGYDTTAAGSDSTLVQSSRVIHTSDKVQQFQQLMLCSRSSVLHMGTQCPQLLDLEASDLMLRLMAIKVGCT